MRRRRQSGRAKRRRARKRGEVRSQTWQTDHFKIMAVKIDKGGWFLIFLIGLGLVGYSLDKYGIVNLRGRLGGSSAAASSEPVDTSKPLALPAAATSDSS